MLKITEKNIFFKQFSNLALLMLLISFFTVLGNAVEINTSIQTGSDDVEERSSGRISFSSSDLEMIDDSDNQTIGLRFINLDIPQGATVTNAYIQFTVDETGSQSTVLNIQGHSVGDAGAFTTTEGDVTSRSRTSALVSWSVPTWDTTKISGTEQQTPELTEVVQEIVDLSDWTNNNSMVFIIDGTGKRVADSYEGGSDRAPKLHITYELNDGGDDTPSTDDNSTDDNTDDNTTTSNEIIIIDTAINHDDDDAEELSNGDISTGSSDLELVYDGDEQTIGMRFTALTIPKGATITNAYLQFTVDERDSEQTLLNIYAQKSATPAFYENIGFNITERTKTSASVSWDVPEWDVTLESDIKQRTPDLKSVVQEVVDLDTWNDNSSLAFMINGIGKRVADSHEGGNERATKLHIEYTLGSVDDNTTDGGTDDNVTDGGDDNTTDGGTDDNVTDSGDDNNTATSSQKLGMLIPLYVYPDLHKSDSEWQRVIDTKKANPEADIIVIANPSSGHFSEADDLYIQAIQKTVEANITVVGYVYTQYGARDIDVVKADIDNWTQFYKDLGVTGIFFDETEGREAKGQRPYYSELTQYIKSQGYDISILNPGITADQTFVDNYTADIIVSFESGYTEYIEDFKTGNVGKTVESDLTSTALMIHDIDTLTHLQQAIADAPADGFDYVYITTGGDGWNDLGRDFEAHITEMLKYDRDPIPDNNTSDGTTDSGTDTNTTDGEDDSNTTDNGTDDGTTDGGEDDNVTDGGDSNQTLVSKTLDISIDSGNNDVEESDTGSMYMDSSDLELVHEGSDQTIGLRFTNLNIPQGATITSAYIQFNVDETGYSDTTLLNIYAQNIDNAPIFNSTTSNVSSRAKTTASVLWDIPVWDVLNEQSINQQTPELKSLVQEVINRSGWEESSALAFIIQGTGKRVADSYEGGAEKAPKLHIEYEVYKDVVVYDPNKTTFIEDSSANILNPDRGLYSADYSLTEATDWNIFHDPEAEGYRIVYAPINLYDYTTTSTLPSSLLDTIDGHLTDAEGKGVKLILRFKYRPDASTSYRDPDLSIIMGHMNQLQEILQNHKEIISVIQAGSIGAWGEWNRLTDEFADTDSNYRSNRRAIIAKLSDIFPDKYIQIRTPMHKELLYGTSAEYKDEGTEGTITSELAFSDDIRAKVGHHNDCLMVDDTNYGTYGENIEFWKDYVANDAKYSAVGGETCGMESGFEYLTDCSNAIPELKRLQYSYLNNVYHQDVLDKWRDQGCYQEIKENLGYRLVATNLDTIKSEDNTTLSVSLAIDNKGFASPYIRSNVNLVLKSEQNSYSFAQSNIDMRTFYADESKNIDTNISLEDVESGNYCLYLQIGENFSAIRLSNSKNSDGVEIWDETLRINTLKCGIEL